MDLQAYRQCLESIKQNYELHVGSGADIHRFNSLYGKAINVLALAERDLHRDGFISVEREAEVKRRFYDLSAYVGKLIPPRVQVGLPKGA